MSEWYIYTATEAACVRLSVVTLIRELIELGEKSATEASAASNPHSPPAIRPSARY